VILLVCSVAAAVMYVVCAVLIVVAQVNEDETR
jgi:hypothetical protein